ncbi:hypothetical protein [Streptomyces sp. NBC_00401]|uniref:hypothetical protein n=1 Tax=unclassified Streptomyces TaxID=2593676 RepID=UPI002252A11E|nr:hypothetical protein [Streptomyces sp. NBC_00401]MCX5084181.1 hypothetical protein [Streptomyces sp. NBC_00401]
MESANSGRRTGNLLFAFAPWIIFDVVASPSTWEYAALAALVAAVVLNLPDLRRGSFKVLEVTGILFFGVMALLALFLDRQDMLWLETYAQVLSSSVIGVVALGSLAFVPFTEQYARETTPQEVWGTPLFRHVNRVLTLVWGGVFVATAVLGLVALHTTSGADWFNWIIPVVLLILAVRFTESYPDQVRERAKAARTAP